VVKALQAAQAMLSCGWCAGKGLPSGHAPLSLSMCQVSLTDFEYAEKSSLIAHLVYSAHPLAAVEKRD
jgi:adenosylmethionine-8-amino-7-oxononanoate aminotransferase